MKNIHILPTDKPSRLFKDDFGKLIYSINIDQEQNHFEPQNIYITSDEEIKERDWIINLETNRISKADFRKDILKSYIAKHFKKIILTTDQDLIKDDAQTIDNKFLEWFVKNPSCEKVEIVNEIIEDTSKDYIIGLGQPCLTVYKIIIPKEELIDCEYCGGDGIYVDGDNNTSKCTMCEKGKIPKEELSKDEIDRFFVDIVCNPKEEHTILDKLEDYFNNTSKEQIQKDWEKTCKQTEDIISPTIDDFLEAQKQFPKQDYSRVHLKYCYQGEYEDSCKYGEDDCPAKPKEERLEEAAEKWNQGFDEYDEFITKHNINIQNSFKAGVKWQAERMYSEEEVLNILYEWSVYKINIELDKLADEIPNILSYNDWFEQFKKK
jgi:hypothetical protein